METIVLVSFFRKGTDLFYIYNLSPIVFIFNKKWNYLYQTLSVSSSHRSNFVAKETHNGCVFQDQFCAASLVCASLKIIVLSDTNRWIKLYFLVFQTTYKFVCFDWDFWCFTSTCIIFLKGLKTYFLVVIIKY